MLKKILFAFVCLSLTSCLRFVNWGKITFNQGCTIKDCTLAQAQKYIRTVKIYNQIETLGIFDALLLSPVTEKYFTGVYSSKNNLTEAEINNFLQSRLNKIENVIAFYILIQEPQKVCGGYFNEEDSYWKVRMDTSTGSLIPKLIKRVELDCEYRLIFAKRFNNYKKCYYVEFDAYSDDGRKIIDNSDFITLCFSSLEKKTFMTWELEAAIPVIYETDYCATDIEKCSTCCESVQ